MKPLLIFFFAICYTGLYAQGNATTDSVAYYDKVFLIAQKQPKFPGDIYKWLSEHLVYPKEAGDVFGTVYLNFIIEKDGSVSNTIVLRGVPNGSVLDSEAVSVVKSMPKWMPGYQNGHPVRVQFALPVKFLLPQYNGSPDTSARKYHTSADTIVTPDGFKIIKVNAKFPGDINKYLAENLKYPDDARNNNVQGTVYVSFVVDKDGSVSAVKVLRGIENGRSLENEAVRVVATMPKWSPGTQNGHPVRQQFNVPVHFILENYSIFNKKKKN